MIYSETIYGMDVQFQRRKHGDTWYYWIVKINGRDIGGDPFSDRKEMKDYCKMYKKTLQGYKQG